MFFLENTELKYLKESVFIPYVKDKARYDWERESRVILLWKVFEDIQQSNMFRLKQSDLNIPDEFIPKGTSKHEAIKDSLRYLRQDGFGFIYHDEDAKKYKMYPTILPTQRNLEPHRGKRRVVI